MIKGVRGKLAAMALTAIVAMGMAPLAAHAESAAEPVPGQHVSSDALAGYASGLDGAEMLRRDEMADVRGEAFFAAAYLAAVACAQYCYPAYMAVSSAVTIGTGVYVYNQ